MLTVLQTISQYVDKSGKIRLKEFKIVYVAPMKALAAEVVEKFSAKLKPPPAPLILTKMNLNH